LWTSAVKLAGAYGLCRTAQTLRLDYNSLKQRVNSQPDDSTELETATAFVEVSPPQSACLPECIVEVENTSGAKLRIHVKGSPAPDVVALIHEFGDRET
jgi:hypothetical protein